MRRALVLSPAAELDLVNIRLWLTQSGAGAKALARRRAIVRALRGLVDHPNRYPVVDYPGIRERPVGRHRIMYRILSATDDGRSTDDVQIIRVFGPGQRRHQTDLQDDN